jgi:hypothetical protein
MGKFFNMESKDKDLGQATLRPACFGDETKFVAYMEEQAADSECARCPSEDECGEFILLKCSRELCF